MLSSVESFGMSVDFGQRLAAIGNDLKGFGPIILAISALAYLIGFLLAYGLSKIALTRMFWGLIAGLTAIPAAFWLMNSVAGLSVLHSTNFLTGWLGIMAGSLAGSLLYHYTINTHNKD
ncbi:MAG: hypothetical protein HKP09_03300 [Enterobacterales bacterium]|nr:hypothetical protein [Enterobacterales bacterium]